MKKNSFSKIFPFSHIIMTHHEMVLILEQSHKHTSIWCLLGGLKCLHASILSILKDIPLGRLRKELLLSGGKKGLHASYFSGEGDNAGNWPRKAGLGTRCSHHPIGQAQLSSLQFPTSPGILFYK